VRKLIDFLTFNYTFYQKSKRNKHISVIGYSGSLKSMKKCDDNFVYLPSAVGNWRPFILVVLF